jgi:hypothetical protein
MDIFQAQHFVITKYPLTFSREYFSSAIEKLKSVSRLNDVVRSRHGFPFQVMSCPSSAQRPQTTPSQIAAASWRRVITEAVATSASSRATH